ncbi:hypothetical protein ACV33P_31040, partial [Pseudomonas aeruginosa]
RLQQVFDQAPLAEGRLTREPVDGAVALHGLGHAYEGVEVLADIDLELEDGSLVALVVAHGIGHVLQCQAANLQFAALRVHVARQQVQQG